jgi:hypothetical protein
MNIPNFASRHHCNRRALSAFTAALSSGELLTGFCPAVVESPAATAAPAPNIFKYSLLENVLIEFFTNYTDIHYIHETAYAIAWSTGRLRPL